MSKLKQTILLLLTATGAAAQVNGGYTFTKLSGSYTELPAGKHVVQTAWQNPISGIVISAPIDFQVFSTPTDATDFLIDSRGRIDYTPTYIGGDFYISGFGASLYGIAASQPAEISYITQGSYPDDTVKVQFKGAGFPDETGHASYVNFQIWLYENGDIVEMRYGPSSITSGQALPGDIGIFYDAVVNTPASIELFGNSANPTTGTGSLGDAQHISDVPANGTIYRFTPAPLGIKNAETTKNIFVTCNPSDKDIFIRVPDFSGPLQCEIYNIAGQKVRAVTLNAKTNRIHVGDMASGLYVIKTSSKEEVNICKILL
jgi:hypothetical protein